MIRKMKMKYRVFRITAAALFTTLTISLSAQRETDEAAMSGIAEDSIRCHENLVRYSTFYETGDLINALSYWRQVIAECPESSEEHYARGETMYRELFGKSDDKAYIDTILMILSQRSLYFNNKPSIYIRKAALLSELGGNDTNYVAQCFDLIKVVADSFPDYIDHTYAVLLMTAAAKSYSLNLTDTAGVLSAYIKAKEIVDKRLQAAPGDPFYTEAADIIDSVYMASGAMTCTGIEKMYSGRISKNNRDTVLINEVFTLLADKGCTGSDFYYSLAVRLFANNRSVKNAIRLAELNYARNNIDKAISYFTDAYNRDTSRLVRSEVLTRVAAMELDQGKRQEARDRSEHAWQLNNKNGKALLIIADCYAGARIGDQFDDHSAYWVAVDYLRTAKEVDPSLSKIADEKIKAYSKLFPTREECFYRNILDEGVIYSVGGWISEITRVRFRRQ